jgi:hypothetical protein
MAELTQGNFAVLYFLIAIHVINCGHWELRTDDKLIHHVNLVLIA